MTNSGNMFCLIGRISKLLDDYFIISVTRTYKDSLGHYPIDFFNVYLSEGSIKDNTHKYLHTGDLVAVKGSLESQEYTDGNKNYRRIVLRANKLSFLSSAISVKDGSDE